MLLQLLLQVPFEIDVTGYGGFSKLLRLLGVCLEVLQVELVSPLLLFLHSLSPFLQSLGYLFKLCCISLFLELLGCLVWLLPLHFSV